MNIKKLDSIINAKKPTFAVFRVDKFFTLEPVSSPIQADFVGGYIFNYAELAVPDSGEAHKLSQADAKITAITLVRTHLHVQGEALSIYDAIIAPLIMNYYVKQPDGSMAGYRTRPSNFTIFPKIGKIDAVKYFGPLTFKRYAELLNI